MEKIRQRRFVREGSSEKIRQDWPQTLVWTSSKGDLATRRRVVAIAESETCVCWPVGYLMPKIFPPVGRSDRGDSKRGVADWK